MWLENDLDVELLNKPILESVDTYAAYAMAAIIFGNTKEATNLLIHLRQTIAMKDSFDRPE
jgi:hypothetical protein